MPNWEFYIPTVYQTGTTTSGSTRIYTAVEFFDPNAMYNGTHSMDTESTLGPSGAYPTMFVDDQQDIDVEYITEPSISGSEDVYLDINSVESSAYSVNVINDLTVSPIGLVDTYNSTEVVFLQAYTPENYNDDVIHEIRLYRVFGNFIDDIDVVFSVPDYHKFYMWTDLVCVAEDTINTMVDVEEGGGRTNFYINDLHNAGTSIHTTRSGIYIPGSTTYSGIKSDLYSTSGNSKYYIGDISDSILFNVCRYVGTTASGTTVSGTTISGAYYDSIIDYGTIISGYSYYGLLNDFSFYNNIFTSVSGGVTVSGVFISNDEIECTTISGGGRTKYINNDAYCIDYTTTDIKSDFRLYSLSLVDFYLDEEQFTTYTDKVWVDIADYIYPIDASQTYLSVNGNRVPTTLSGIEVSCQDIVYNCTGTLASGHGYRLYYDPGNTFMFDEPFTISVHAENVLGDTLDHDFVILSGYNVEYNERERWKANTKYYVWSKASNEAFCPNEGTGEFYFVTKELPSIRLDATIKPVVPVDLGATIYPQSTAFFYGKTYTVTISGVKDFYGNEMESFTYTFTLEDPTN